MFDQSYSVPDVSPADQDTGYEVLHQTQQVLVPQEDNLVNVLMETLDLVFPEDIHLQQNFHNAVCKKRNTNHSYFIRNPHRYGEDRAEYPDDEDDHHCLGLGDVWLEWEHYSLISVHCDGCQCEDAGVNTEVLV